MFTKGRHDAESSNDDITIVIPLLKSSIRACATLSIINASSTATTSKSLLISTKFKISSPEVTICASIDPPLCVTIFPEEYLSSSLGLNAAILLF